jgi:sugar phosphate isomerase/epimerase
MTQTPSSRREFIRRLAALGSVPFLAVPARSAVAAGPVTRPYGSYMKLSLAAYSFNKLLPRDAGPEAFKEAKMRLDDFVRYCAELGLDACEPTAYYFPKDVTNEYLLELKNLAFRLGLDVSGTAIGNDFCLPPGPERDAQLAMTRDWIDRAAILGAPVIRIFAGKVPAGDTEDAAVERCVEGIDESLNYAAQRGVFLALENHGGITATAEQLLRIVQRVKESPWFGVNFDGGNFASADPYAELERIAPYAVNAQIKACVKRNGQKEPADLARIVGILKDAGYRGYVVLEYEEDEDPFKAIPPLIDRLRTLTA